MLYSYKINHPQRSFTRRIPFIRLRISRRGLPAGIENIKLSYPKVTRAARIGALLFARHADIYAAAMRKRGGEYAGYTAMDYYNKAFALDISG